MQILQDIVRVIEAGMLALPTHSLVESLILSLLYNI